MADKNSSRPCRRIVSGSALSVPHNGHDLVIPSLPYHLSVQDWQPIMVLQHLANVTPGFKRSWQITHLKVSWS